MAGDWRPPLGAVWSDVTGWSVPNARITELEGAVGMPNATLTDTRLRARFRELRARYFDRREAWRVAVGRQDLCDAYRHKTSAHRLLRKSYDVEAKAHARAEWWAGGSYED